MGLQDVLEWCSTATLQDLVLVLDEIVVLLRNAIIVQDDGASLPNIPQIIEQSLVLHGWHLAAFAQATGLELPRLRQILDREPPPPSREELAAIAPYALKQDSSAWTTEELDVVAKIQYGEFYYSQYPSLPVLVCRNWDYLCEQSFPVERLQAIRDGFAPTDLDILRLALYLRLDESFIRQLAAIAP